MSARDFPGMDVLERPMTDADASMFGRGARQGLPGVTVSERPMLPNEGAQFGMGPGNPNVGPNGSTQAQAFRASGAAAPGAATPVAPGTPAPTVMDGAAPSFLNRVKGVGARIADVAGKGVGFIGRAAGLAGVGTGAYEAASGVMEGNAQKAALGAGDALASGALATGVGTIPALGYLGARGAYTASDALMPDSVKDHIGGFINSMLPASMATNTDAMDKIHNAEAMGRNIVTGGAYNPSAAAAPASPNPADQRLAAGTATLPPDTALPGSPVKGAGDARKVVDANGKVTYANVADDGVKNPVNVVPAFGNEAIERGARANAIYASINGGMGNVGNGELTTTPGMGVMSGKTIFDDNRTDHVAQGGSYGTSTANDGLSARQRMQRGIAQQESQDRRDIARMGNETQRAINERQVGATLRGQDLSHEASMYGHEITGANARARLGYDMRKDARDYDLNVQKFNEEQGQHAFERNSKAQKDTQERIASMIPNGPDGKPDTATASRYMQNFNAHLSDVLGGMRQAAAKGDQGAVAALKDFEKNGHAALGEDYLAKFIASEKANDLSRQYGSHPLNPVGGTAVTNNVPGATLRHKQNYLTGNEYEILDGQGRPTGATIPERAVTGDGGWIFRGARRTDLDTIKR